MLLALAFSVILCEMYFQGQTMATNDAPLNVAASRGLSLALGQANTGPLTDAEWEARLTRTGSGTPDSSFDLDNAFTFLGAFKITPFTNDANPTIGTNSLSSISFKPSDGSNGPNGSLFISSVKWVAEVDIPALSMDTNHANLNSTTILQNWVDALAKAPSGNANSNSVIGWTRLIGGRLFMSAYAGYDGDGNNTQPILIANNPNNLAGGTWQGFIDYGVGDKGARYILDVPSGLQATFNGATHFSGVCADLNIIDRSSFGHSLIGWSPASVQPSDTTATTEIWSYYPPENKINDFSRENPAIMNHYAAILNPPGAYDILDYYDAGDVRLNDWPTGSLAEYLAIPISETGRDITTFDNLALPDESLRNHTVTYNSKCGCGFIVPGTDTIVFIGSNDGSRYGAPYKTYTIEDGPSGRYGAGFDVASKFDYDNYVWLMNVNDVATQVNSYDSDYYFSKPINDLGPHNQGAEHRIVSGHFDTATNKLYLASKGHTFNQFVDQVVVSVFQVGSGV